MSEKGSARVRSCVVGSYLPAGRTSAVEAWCRCTRFLGQAGVADKAVDLDGRSTHQHVKCVESLRLLRFWWCWPVVRKHCRLCCKAAPTLQESATRPLPIPLPCVNISKRPLAQPTPCSTACRTHHRRRDPRNHAATTRTMANSSLVVQTVLNPPAALARSKRPGMF